MTQTVADGKAKLHCINNMFKAGRLKESMSDISLLEKLGSTSASRPGRNAGVSRNARWAAYSTSPFLLELFFWGSKRKADQ